MNRFARLLSRRTPPPDIGLGAALAFVALCSTAYVLKARPATGALPAVQPPAAVSTASAAEPRTIAVPIVPAPIVAGGRYQSQWISARGVSQSNGTPFESRIELVTDTATGETRVGTVLKLDADGRLVDKSVWIGSSFQDLPSGEAARNQFEAALQLF